jgi:NAD(P)-dependent dehydrogenase (short-subunit alcohol dehydrogenase family)
VPGLKGRRVLITGAARGIGAALAERLHARGARVALAGLEEERLAHVAARCGGAPWAGCDVTDRAQVEAAVGVAVDTLPAHQPPARLRAAHRLARRRGPRAAARRL